MRASSATTCAAAARAASRLRARSALFTQTCPKEAAATGPYRAASWPAIHPGRVIFQGNTAQTVTSACGNPATGAAIDPIMGGGDACCTVPTERAPGTAVYLGSRSGGYTLIGLPTVTADIVTHGGWGQPDSRLWDVAPTGPSGS